MTNNFNSLENKTNYAVIAAVIAFILLAAATLTFWSLPAKEDFANIKSGVFILHEDNCRLASLNGIILAEYEVQSRRGISTYCKTKLVNFVIDSDHLVKVQIEEGKSLELKKDEIVLLTLISGDDK